MSDLPRPEQYEAWIKKIDSLMAQMDVVMPKWMYNHVYGSFIYVRAQLRNFQNLDIDEKQSKAQDRWDKEDEK